ncbi:MAG TPA: CNNM domain-containing protein [Mycobacteriales bacterium]
MSDGAAVGVAVLLLAANAFFVAAEFALISARRSAIEQRGRTRAGRVTLRAMERVSLMLAGAQLGITICSLGLGALAEPAVAHLLDPVFAAVGLPESVRHPVSFALALAVVVFLHVVVGEMVPKNLTLAGPDRAALLLGPPLAGLVVVLKPVIVVLNTLANLGLRALRVEPKDEVTSAFTREEVAGLLAESRREGLLEPGRERLLSEALAFDERTVGGIVVPVRSVVTVPASVTPAEVEALVARTGYSRFPVLLDGAMTGYVHVKDLLGVPDRDRPMDPAVIRALPAVGADSSLRAALQQMQTTGAHLIRVVDAAGALLGVVMLEDALEELVGEITDANRRT